MSEALIKDSLIRLNAASAGQRSAAQAELLLREIETLDSLFASARRQLHPQLAHFLQHRSYAKALDFLGGSAGEIPAHAFRPQPLAPDDNA